MRVRSLALLIALAVPAAAQYRVPASYATRVNEAIDANRSGGKLDCEILRFKPELDFSFRFNAGFAARCPIRLFGGEATGMITYLRITPAGGAPVLLQDRYSLPGMPPDMRGRTDLHALNNAFQLSGAFAMGEGSYTVELFMIDDQNRTLKRRWNVKAQKGHDEREVEVAIRPGAIGTLGGRPWDGTRTADGKRVRVTVLLHASPINPRAASLRAWDRAFLLDSVTSLLRQVPWDSVRLVAFNLDQQREIFREDNFSRASFGRLARSLRQLELGTVSYDVVKRPEGASELLVGLANQEVAAQEPSDVVIFLGPVSRYPPKTPAASLNPLKPNSPRFYYLEYYPVWRRGGEFSDAVNALTANRNGSSIKIHSPGELARGIQKILSQLRPQKDQAVD